MRAHGASLLARDLAVLAFVEVTEIGLRESRIDFLDRFKILRCAWLYNVIVLAQFGCVMPVSSASRVTNPKRS
jgi:hypothetical protein